MYLGNGWGRRKENRLTSTLSPTFLSFSLHLLSLSLCLVVPCLPAAYCIIRSQGRIQSYFPSALSLSLSLSLALSDWMSALEVEGGEGRSEGSGRMGENESRGRKRGRDGEMEFSGGGERGWVSERDQMQAKRKRKLQDKERVKQLT